MQILYPLLLLKYELYILTLISAHAFVSTLLGQRMNWFVSSQALHRVIFHFKTRRSISVNRPLITAPSAAIVTIASTTISALPTLRPVCNIYQRPACAASISAATKVDQALPRETLIPAKTIGIAEGIPILKKVSTFPAPKVLATLISVLSVIRIPV